MLITDYEVLLGLGGAITTLGGAWLTIKKIGRVSENSRKAHSAAILQSAKEADNVIKVKLEAKIHELESELKNLKGNVEKDVLHIKETYNSEIKFLGQKIEELRAEFRGAHSQLVQLLTKMIEKD